MSDKTEAKCFDAEREDSGNYLFQHVPIENVVDIGIFS